jgi:hypothetical protein
VGSMLLLPQQTDGKVIRIRARELLIITATIFLGLSILLSRMGIVGRVGVFIAMVGTGLVLALGRDPRSGMTPETMMLRACRSLTGQEPHFGPPGGAAASSDEDPGIDASSSAPIDFSLVWRSGLEKEEFWISPIPICAKTLLTIPASSVLLMGLAWAWSGGL